MRSAVLVALSIIVGCSAGAPDRRGELVAALTDADAPLVRSRPGLVAGKYEKMATDFVDFYRGTLPLYAHDWREGRLRVGRSDFAIDAPLVLSSGDAHPENFGTMRAGDGSWALEPNDFDSADRLPYLWDVRRLCAGMVLVARQANPDDADARAAASDAARAIARAAAEGYRDTIFALANGGPRPRMTPDGADPVSAHLFKKSLEDWDARAELTDFTTLEGTTRRLKRGVLDPTDPTQILADVPASALATLQAAVNAYAASLAAPPDLAQLTVLDAAREFGSGVASWPRIRVLVLVRGPSDDPTDDLVLELKELGDSGVGGWIAPGTPEATPQDRVLRTLHAAWAVPDSDPLWGASSWLGIPVQLKTRADGFKGFKVENATGKQGTPDALAAFARTLGGIIARVHASTPELPNAAAMIAARIGADGERFADEQADFAVSYEAQAESDWQTFQAALAELGPTLGVHPGPDDGPPPELAPLLTAPVETSP